ncbi:hypothetical protein ALC56_08104 [Trachymyrmex septentrionalis]|uniref:Uncharacterized protein n=1 Tax=Trachymyrmex septentrionalis TaxID=34720 RepID=A0A151JVQ9_9HYME|nr:hypothetical protein ALC56_08104 [Trachymyrmex septentrionalis]
MRENYITRSYVKSNDLRPQGSVRYSRTATYGVAADKIIFESRCCERDCRGEERKEQGHEDETSVAVAAVKMPIRLRVDRSWKSSRRGKRSV